MNDYVRIIGNKYKIIKKIGSGSFGRVYKGENILNGEFIAIKEISKSLLEGSDYLYEAFGKELEIMKLCESKNSVKLIEHLEDEENHYIIMELCDSDLEIILKKREKGFSENELKIILIQLNIILYKMHIKQVIHRDIKLKNILIKFDNNIPLIGFIPKLSDFGFSKIMEEDITQTKLGTPATMAPEILMNKKYNTKADLWSLGIIIYQLLFKKFPFKARNERELLSIIMKSNSINIPHDSDHQISDCLIDLINNLLKKDQNDRIDFDSYFSHKFFQGVNLEDFKYDNNNELKEKENNLNLNLTFEERFSIIKKISNEFIGFNIFQAKDKLNGNLVYIKEFPKNIIDGNTIYKRIFDKEIELLKNLKGEQFIEFIDLFINESSYFIITENFEGKILDDFIKEKNGLNEDFVCKIFNQLIPSFKILNEKKIVLEFISCKSFSFKHFISEDNFKIKFFDYGISIIFSSEIERNNYLLNEGKLGNVIDPKTNILSLGLITYKMLFNDYIYKFNKNESINETIERQKSIKINKIISKNCKYFIEKMCHLQIEKRYDWNSFFNDSFIKGKNEEKKKDKINEIKNYKIQDNIIENIFEYLNNKILTIINYYQNLLKEGGELNNLIKNSKEISICIMLSILETKLIIEFLKNKERFNEDEELHLIKLSINKQTNNLAYQYSYINFISDEVTINKENTMIDSYKNKFIKMENQLRDILTLFSKKVNLDFGNDNLENLSVNKDSCLGNIEKYFFYLFEEALIEFSKKEYENSLEILNLSRYISEYIIFIYLIVQYSKQNCVFTEILESFNNNVNKDLKTFCFISFIGGAIKTFKAQKIIEESDMISFEKNNSESFIEFYPEIVKLIIECKNKINEQKEQIK